MIEQNHAFPVVDKRDAAVGADAVVHMHDIVARLQILKIGNECGEFLTTTMRRLGVLDFVEDIRLGINQQCGIGQTQTGGKPADADKRSQRVIDYLQRLLSELQPKGNLVFMQEVPKALGHAQRAAEKHHLSSVR